MYELTQNPRDPDYRALRRCASCKKHRRNASFRVVHDKVHAMCNTCYVKLRLSLDKKGRLKALMRRRWAGYIASAEAQGVAWLLTKMDFVGLWQQQCWWCLTPIQTIGLCRLDADLPFSPENTRPCCKRCNWQARMRV